MKPCPFCGEVPKLVARSKPQGGGAYSLQGTSIMTVDCCPMIDMLQTNLISEALWDERPMVHKIIVDVDGGYACEV